MRPLASAVGGAVLALIVMISCSDDSPGDVDAAPNCEPPLAGRLMRIEDVKTNQASGNVNAGAVCPAGATLVGGGCEVAGQNSETLVLNIAGGNSALGHYECNWRNPSAITVETVRAWAVCLSPAP